MIRIKINPMSAIGDFDHTKEYELPFRLNVQDVFQLGEFAEGKVLFVQGSAIREDELGVYQYVLLSQHLFG